MNVRSRKNKNLRLTNKKTFLGRPIQTEHGPLYIDYLEKMHNTIDLALDEYPRLMAIRVDLRFPKLRKNEMSGNVISSLKITVVTVPVGITTNHRNQS